MGHVAHWRGQIDEIETRNRPKGTPFQLLTFVMFLNIQKLLMMRHERWGILTLLWAFASWLFFQYKIWNRFIAVVSWLNFITMRNLRNKSCLEIRDVSITGLKFSMFRSRSGTSNHWDAWSPHESVFWMTTLFEKTLLAPQKITSVRLFLLLYPISGRTFEVDDRTTNVYYWRQEKLSPRRFLPL